MTEPGSNRVVRGGSWNNNAQNLRSAYRNNDSPGDRNDNLGFRLVSTLNLCAHIKWRAFGTKHSEFCQIRVV